MDEDKLKILLNSVKDRYDFITIADGAIEAKAGVLLGFEITILIGLLSFFLKDLIGIKLVEGIAGVVFLIISIVLLLKSTWPRKYNAFSVDVFNHKDYLEKTERDLLNQMLSDSQKATLENKDKSEAKANFYRWSMYLLIVSLLALILSKLPTLYV
ncbi:MAG: hypothetical protein MCSN_1730 [Candidatus Microsyncoccus archaeolyticus]|nr:MAG: hypothetical protein MCSN_1730 [Candidatus Parcubacteria bacterium]